MGVVVCAQERAASSLAGADGGGGRGVGRGSVDDADNCDAEDAEEE